MKYRMLKYGEPLQEGDEFLSYEGKDNKERWLKTTFAGEQVPLDDIYRRPECQNQKGQQ